MKNIKFVSYALAISVLLFSKSAIAEQNIYDIVIAAQNNNSKLQAAKQDLEVAKIGKTRAFSGFLPSISAQGSSSKMNPNPNQSNDPLAAAERQTVNSGKLVASQQIFSGGKTVASISQARSAVLAAEAAYQLAFDGTVMTAINAYEDVLTFRQLHKISIENEEVMKRQLETAEIKFKAGEITRTDVSEAKYHFTAAITQKQQSFGKMKNAESAFYYATGLQAQEHMKKIDISALKIPETLEEFSILVHNSNLSLVQAKNQLDAAKSAVHASAAGLLPTLEVSGSIAKDDIPTIQAGSRSGSTISAAINVPIFDRALTWADIKEKKHSAKKAEYALDDARGNLESQIVQIWTQYQVAKYSMTSNSESINAARDASLSANEEFKVGAKTMTDVLRAQQQLFRAKQDLKQTEQNMTMSMFQMHYLMGDLTRLDFRKFIGN